MVVTEFIAQYRPSHPHAVLYLITIAIRAVISLQSWGEVLECSVRVGGGRGVCLLLLSSIVVENVEVKLQTVLCTFYLLKNP